VSSGPLAWLRQAALITGLNLRSLPQRAGASAAAMLGVAGVVAVLVAVLSIGEGFRRTLATNGDDATVIVFRGGTDTEMNSVLTLEETRIIKSALGIEQRDGQAVASAELFVTVDLPKITTGTDANVPLRGVQPTGISVRRDFRMVEGRPFALGQNEIIAGASAAKQFAGLFVGNTLKLGGNQWKVVGIFETGGTVSESELWADAAVLQPAYRRGNSFQSVYARLTRPEAFEDFKAALATDPRLDIQVLRERVYYEQQSLFLTTLITTLGTLIAILMGIGAVFGALNTMYTAVAARSREIATLRAVGFGGSAVVVSVLTEATLLALIGGVAGGLVAYVGFNGYQTSTMNWQSFSQVSFAFAVTPRLLVLGIVYSLLMGLVGGMFPAIRAARLPVATALRQL